MLFLKRMDRVRQQQKDGLNQTLSNLSLVINSRKVFKCLDLPPYCSQHNPADPIKLRVKSVLPIQVKNLNLNY